MMNDECVVWVSDGRETGLPGSRVTVSHVRRDRRAVVTGVDRWSTEGESTS